ncbi:MAG: lysophospholipid acyltransferase family protein [Limisphaerales bacterium]
MNSTPFANRSTKICRLKRALQTPAFLGAYLIFAVLGSVVSVACLVPAALFRGQQANRFGQRLICGLFAFFVGYLRACGLVKLDTGELSALRNCRGLILVANHPCLLDAVFIVSQLPHVVCLMKRSLVRNIVLCGTAKLAGYVDNTSGVGLVRTCEARLRRGANLLIFPEGTRSTGGELLPFKMGFALIAGLAQSPVQTVIIAADSNYLGKGWPLFRKPPFPARYSLRLGKRFDPSPSMDAKSFGCEVERYFHRVLTQPPGPAAPLSP